MKSIALTILTFVLCIATLSAQDKYVPKNNFKFGYGTSYLKTGEYFGKLQYLEYNRSLLRPLSIGIIGSRTKANQLQDNGFEQKTNANQAELNLYLLPLNNNVNAIKLGGGAVYRQMNYATLSSEVLGNEWKSTRTENFGFSVSLEYEVYIARHVILGSKASFQQFENKDRAFNWGLNFGVRF